MTSSQFRLRAWCLILTTLILGAGSSSGLPVRAAIYYVSSQSGKDSNTGLSGDEAWKSLARASEVEYAAKDELRLQRSCIFHGSLIIQASGTPTSPVVVAPYGVGAVPIINGQGYLAGLHLKNCKHVVVQELEITADGGNTLDGSSNKKRYGVLADTWSSSANGLENITLLDLYIHDIYPAKSVSHEGRNSTTCAGFGIEVNSRNKESSRIRIEKCRISRTGFQGISLKKLSDVQVLDNYLENIGGPGIQPGNCQRVVVRGNTTDHTGSSLDPRMHGRGSGIWPWSCTDVLIEKNSFRHARGKGDSCGTHIDYNCRDVVVQHNLSYDNEGGFVEILGNCHNCTYRYNISVDDGSREKGRNGAEQNGKVLWTSGFVGKRPPVGPFNCYIYNNTIFSSKGTSSRFLIAPTTKGLLVANNIFHLTSDSIALGGPKEEELSRQSEPVSQVFFRNNLYLNDAAVPVWLPVSESQRVCGDPHFANPGGQAPIDYIPRNNDLVRDRGIPIKRLPGDSVGIRRGLRVKTDFFGNPVNDRPDFGAIEIVEPAQSETNPQSKHKLASEQSEIAAH